MPRRDVLALFVLKEYAEAGAVGFSLGIGSINLGQNRSFHPPPTSTFAVRALTLSSELYAARNTLLLPSWNVRIAFPCFLPCTMARVVPHVCFPHPTHPFPTHTCTCIRQHLVWSPSCPICSRLRPSTSHLSTPGGGCSCQGPRGRVHGTHDGFRGHVERRKRLDVATNAHTCTCVCVCVCVWPTMDGEDTDLLQPSRSSPFLSSSERRKGGIHERNLLSETKKGGRNAPLSVRGRGRTTDREEERERVWNGPT